MTLYINYHIKCARNHFLRHLPLMA